MTLDKLKPGEDAYIRSIGGSDLPLRKHMLDMGLTPGTEVTMVKAAPMGDPLQLTVRGYELTLQDIAANLITGIGKMEEDMAWMWPLEAQE